MTTERWRGDAAHVWPYIDCGALGHTWDIVDSNHWVAPWGEPLTMRCMRCNMEKRYMLRRGTDEPLGTARYIQPPGYRFERGERPKRQDFLLMATDENRRNRKRRRTSISVTEPKP